MTNKERYLNSIKTMAGIMLSDFDALDSDQIEGIHWFIDMSGSITGLFDEVETLKKTVEKLEDRLNKIES